VATQIAKAERGNDFHAQRVSASFQLETTLRRLRNRGRSVDPARERFYFDLIFLLARFLGAQADAFRHPDSLYNIYEENQ
jgi:hypothetical protein